MKHKIFIDGYIGDLSSFGIKAKDCYTFSDFESDLSKMPKTTKVLDVHIDSGGGLVTDGYKMYDALNALDGIVVNTIAEKNCKSIATVIAQAGKRNGVRKGYMNTDYTIHFPLWKPEATEIYNAQDLELVTAALKKEEETILNIYASSSTTPKDSIMAKMAEDMPMSCEEAKSLGLIDEIISESITAFVEYKIAAVIIPPLNKQNTMSELKAEFKAGFSKLEKMIANFTNGKMLNMTVKTTEGVDIYFEGELMEGSKVFADESMTVPAPDGVHTYDGKLYTVTGGVVTKVEEISAQKTDLELANEKIAALEATIAAKDTEVINAKTEVAKAVAKAIEIEATFVAVKNQIVNGGKEIFNTAPVEKGTPKAEAKSLMDEVVALRKAKAEKK